jgi:hypothetical protein
MNESATVAEPPPLLARASSALLRLAALDHRDRSQAETSAIETARLRAETSLETLNAALIRRAVSTPGLKLVMGSDASWLRKAAVLITGYITITFVQVWGVVFQSLKMLAFNFGAQTHELVREAGVSDSVIALGYQLGSLILPALAPIFVWVLMNRRLVEQFVGWKVGELNRPNSG